MSKIASKGWIVNNIGGGQAWTSDLTNLPSYAEIISTGEYNVNDSYQNNQLVKQESISIVEQKYTFTIYDVPSYTNITFIHYYNSEYYCIKSVSNTSTSTQDLTIQFETEYDEFEFSPGGVSFWFTALDTYGSSTHSQGIYCMDYGSGSGPVLLDHYDETPVGVVGQKFQDDEIPHSIEFQLSDFEVDDFKYEMTVTSNKVHDFNYGDGTLQFVNNTGDDLIIQLEHGNDIDFSQGNYVTVSKPSDVTDGINIYINFIKDGNDISDDLEFTYNGAPGYSSPWSGYFLSQIYSNDLYTIDRGPIYVTYR